MSCNANTLGTWKTFRNLMAGSCLALFSQLPVLAVQNVALTWLPSTNANVTGYLIYSGTESRAYTKVFLVGNVTNTIVIGLTEGATNFFAAKAFDAMTNESSFSEETSLVVPTLVIPPVTNSIPPTNPPPVETNTPPVIDPAITNTPPVITNTPPVITNTPPVITNTPPVITNTPPVITNTPPVITNTPPVITNTPPVVTNAPPVVTNRPPTSGTSNQPPTLNGLPNLSLIKNSAAVTVNLSGITSGSTSEKQTLAVTASSGNSALISKVTVNYSSPNRTGTLIFKPTVNATGSAVITVSVNDGHASNNIVTKTFNVTVTAPPPKMTAAMLAMPKISRQLTNAATLAGRNILLSVGVTGRAPFNYQWKCNGTNIVGATGTTLTLKNVNASQSGVYSVLVSNYIGSTNSLPATVTVYSTPAAVLTNSVQSKEAFSFVVAGVPGYKYVVQASSDMQHWSSMRTNTSPFTFMDTNCISFNQRYYRSYYLP